MATNITYTTSGIIKIAKCHKRVNWFIVWYFIIFFLVEFIFGSMPQIRNQMVALTQIVLVITAAFLIYQLAVALKASNPWLWALVVLLPCGGLVAMLILSLRGTKALKLQGIRVGLMGARKRDLPSDDALSQKSTNFFKMPNPCFTRIRRLISNTSKIRKNR